MSQLPTKQDLLKVAKQLIVNKEVAKLMDNKTMIRRVIVTDLDIGYHLIKPFKDKFIKETAKYQVDDILWLREPVKVLFNNMVDDNIYDSSNIEYSSNGTLETFFKIPKKYHNKKWFLQCQGVPNGCIKEMARKFYRVTSVRVERLQDISDEDIYNEGIEKYCEIWSDKNDGKKFNSIRWAFQDLWNSTAKKGVNDWDSNPYVFCYSLQEIKYEAN